MIKLAVLNNLKFIPWGDFEPYIITENDKLYLNFKSDIYSVYGATVSLKNGNVRKDYIFYGSPIEVDKSLLFEGRIDCLVTIKENLKTFYIDGIKVKIIDEQACVTSFFNSLQACIEDHEERISALEKDKETVFD